MIPSVSDLPVGKLGTTEIDRFVISSEEALHIRARQIMNYDTRLIEAGTYTRLSILDERGKSHCVMSDTPAEKSDHWYAVQNAHGRIHINGLGIGMVLNACLLKSEVEHATVLEINPEVIALVAPHYQQKFGDRLEIIQGDALTFRPERDSRYGMVWHDIWITPDEVAYEQMKLLRRRWGRHAEWQGSWAKRRACETARVGRKYA